MQHTHPKHTHPKQTTLHTHTPLQKTKKNKEEKKDGDHVKGFRSLKGKTRNIGKVFQQRFFFSFLLRDPSCVCRKGGRQVDHGRDTTNVELGYFEAPPSLPNGLGNRTSEIGNQISGRGTSWCVCVSGGNSRCRLQSLSVVATQSWTQPPSLPSHFPEREIRCPHSTFQAPGFQFPFFRFDSWQQLECQSRRLSGDMGGKG